MHLSVIVPVKYIASTLDAQTEALSNQLCKKPWELILSFNKSTDKLRVIERKFKKKFYSLRIIDASKKQGLSYARNIGAKFAEGDTFAFCDADAEVDKNWLKALSNTLSKHDVACGRNLFYNFKGDISEQHLDRVMDIDQLAGHSFIPKTLTCNFGVRRYVHEANGGFDENIYAYEDVDYCWRIKAKGHKIKYVPEATIHCRLRPMSLKLSQLFCRTKYSVTSEYYMVKRFRSHSFRLIFSFQDDWIHWLHTLKHVWKFLYLDKKKRITWLRRFVYCSSKLLGHIKGILVSPRNRWSI